jgi:anti-sigma-K factor RskA
MTTPDDSDLIAVATPYALHAVSDAEIADIERRVASSPDDVVRAFDEEVRAVRETMAVVSAATALEPPDRLRGRILASLPGPPAIRQRRRINTWQATMLAAAAAVVIGLGAVGVGMALRPAHTPSMAEQVFTAPDVRTVSGQIPTGGTATVVFSREKNAGVLVMNNVAPPRPGTVYQMWLIDPKGSHSAGTMDAKNVAPSTTATLADLGDSQALAFTIEPPGGSARPTSQPFAKLPLV